MVTEAVKEKVRKAFDIKYLGVSVGKKEYLVTRTDPSVEWLDKAAILKVCDDGWDGYFRGEQPRHFGGRFGQGPKDSQHVAVYID